MELKKIGIALGFLVGLTTAWGLLGEKIWQQVKDGQKPVQKIIFDNGTVRKHRDVSTVDADGFKAGELRKCQMRNEVIYTDTLCPHGAKAVAVAAMNVSTLPAEKVKVDERLTQVFKTKPSKSPEEQGRELADIKAARIDAVVGQ